MGRLLRTGRRIEYGGQTWYLIKCLRRDPDGTEWWEAENDLKEVSLIPF